MKSTFSTEWVGYGGSPKRIIPPKKPWVAQIQGFDSKFGFKREFINPRIDLSEAGNTRKRGVKCYWFLDPGIYECFYHLSWKTTERYFFRATGAGTIKKITEEEVKIGFDPTESRFDFIEI